MVLFRFFIALMPIAASVPRTVDTMAAVKVICRVVVKAPMIVSSWKHSAYHFRVKPPQTTRDLELLKESTIRTRIGRYKNKNIIAR